MDLKLSDFVSYGRDPLLSDRDHTVERYVAERFLSSSRPDSSTSEVLLAYGERMASWSVRSGDKDLWRSGALGALWAEPKDKREALIVWTLLYSAAVTLGLDPAAELRAVASHIGGDVVEDINVFLQRDPADLDPGVMGYRVDIDGTGPVFVRKS